MEKQQQLDTKNIHSLIRLARQKNKRFPEAVHALCYETALNPDYTPRMCKEEPGGVDPYPDRNAQSRRYLTAYNNLLWARRNVEAKRKKFGKGSNYLMVALLKLILATRAHDFAYFDDRLYCDALGRKISAVPLLSFTGEGAEECELHARCLALQDASFGQLLREHEPEKSLAKRPIVDPDTASSSSKS